MSTGAECYFREVQPGSWMLMLQAWPYGDNPDYEKYGPFPSFAAANRELDENHANPGGYQVVTHKTGHVHEWGLGSAQRKVGHHLEIDILSLGPNATQQEVIAFAKGLPTDHGAWRVRPRYDYVDAMTCQSCGEPQP